MGQSMARGGNEIRISCLSEVVFVSRFECDVIKHAERVFYLKSNKMTVSVSLHVCDSDVLMD